MERTYSDKELDGMKPEHHKFTYEGKVYDTYSASQAQRRIERTIRKQKRILTAAEALGDEQGATNAKSRLQQLNRKYRDFSKAAGLPEQRERIKVLYT